MGILTEPLSFTRQHGEPNYIVCSFNHSHVPYQRFYLQCRNTAGQGTTSFFGFSSLPPLVVGRKTLVAAGHVTIQNLGGKKTCWVGGVAEYFVW